MKKKTVLTVLLIAVTLGTVYAQTAVQRSLYVSANGDDDKNNGRNEETSFKSLERAADVANAGVIKTITIIGAIGNENIYQQGPDEILVTGKTNASEAEKAVIRNASVQGKVRFTNIRIECIEGSKEATVTLGAGVVVTNTNSYGVKIKGSVIMTGDAAVTGCDRFGIFADTVIMSGNAKISNNKEGGLGCTTLTMSENAEISGNSNSTGSGGVSVTNLTMSGNAKIINNSATKDGGGVYLEGNYKAKPGSSTISGNAIISGNTAKNGGGIYLQGPYAILTMEGGTISGNKADYGAGVYVGKGPFNHKGGTITGNTAGLSGGGEYAKKDAIYSAVGGKVSGNTAGDGSDDVFKQ